MKHPIQYTESDDGYPRFIANEIVRKLLDDGPFDMNDVAGWDVSREDQEQFTQLIGYSLSGAAELSHMSDEVLDAAMEDRPEFARTELLERRLEVFKTAMAEPIADLYGIHPDDLERLL